MQMHESLRARREQVLQAWRTQTERSLSERGSPAQQLLDSMPLFVDQLVRTLAAHARGADVQPGIVDGERIAGNHGIQRLHIGFAIEELVREYGLLRDAIYEVLAPDGPFEHTEHQLLSRALTVALAQGVQQYARERDAEIENATARHLAFLAHEIRNPLMTAGVAAYAVTRHVGEGGRAPAETLRRSLERTSSLVDRALVDVRLRFGARAIREQANLAELVRDLLEDSSFEALEKRITLRVEAPRSLSFAVDPVLLRSALSNLVRNAVKFTQPGREVVVRLVLLDGHLRIEVQDGCGGLPKGSAERMFQPFVQLGRDRSGFGLGLAIAKQAAEAHRGSIVVHDIPGSGCVMVLDLPPE